MKKFKQVGKSRAMVEISRERCKECGLCISVCPQEGLFFDEQLNQQGFHPVRFSNQVECIGCRRCQLMCPDLAIRGVKERKGGGRQREDGLDVKQTV